jgi:hypothetical protein
MRVMETGEEGREKIGDKVRRRALIKLFITIKLIHDFEYGALLNNFSPAIQDHILIILT